VGSTGGDGEYLNGWGISSITGGGGVPPAMRATGTATMIINARAKIAKVWWCFMVCHQDRIIGLAQALSRGGCYIIRNPDWRLPRAADGDSPPRIGRGTDIPVIAIIGDHPRRPGRCRMGRGRDQADGAGIAVAAGRRAFADLPANTEFLDELRQGQPFDRPGAGRGSGEYATGWHPLPDAAYSTISVIKWHLTILSP